MSGGKIDKRGMVRPIGHVTQRISSHLCGKHKHLRYGRLFVEWKLIFPDEVGILYQPIRLVGSKLWVRTSSTQAALLTYFSPNMVERINQYLGNDVVTSIQAHQSVKVLSVPKLDTLRLQPLSLEAINCVQDMAESSLKEALQRWGQWLEADKKD